MLLGNTLAARPDRARLLASLLVIFGAAFVVKFVLLGALYAPESGLTKRVVMALVEGVSLGSLAYQPPGPATGYVAFAAVLLFLAGVATLPHTSDLDVGRSGSSDRRARDRRPACWSRVIRCRPPSLHAPQRQNPRDVAFTAAASDASRGRAAPPSAARAASLRPLAPPGPSRPRPRPSRDSIACISRPDPQ